MQERAELDQALLAVAHADLARDLDGQLDDAAAVLAGVVVVVLDDFAEEQRDALVGRAELDLLLDPVRALLRERGDHGGQREDAEDRGRADDGDGGGEQADRRERGVDEPHDRELADVEARPAAGDHPDRDRRHQRVDAELGAERQQPPGPVVTVDAVDAGGDEDDRGAEREPGVAEPDEQALGVAAAEHDVDGAPEDERDGDERRRGGGRHEEEDRDDDELGRDGEAGGEDELHRAT